MCRWFSYISTKEILLEDAVVNPVHAITQQARGEFQEENLLNADGFGIAWYTKTLSEFDKEKSFGTYPALYRTTTGKALNDATFRYLCRGSASNVILAHLRGAFGAVSSTNNHPFVFGRSTFMHNGFIARFKDIRSEMLKKIRSRYTKLISGSTDSEHFAALYFTYLDKEKPVGYFGNTKEKKHDARAMYNALARTIRQVEDIQMRRFKQKLNNGLNICTTNGESLIAICYRTNPWAPPATLYVSVVVPDKLNRTTGSYEEPGRPSDEELAAAKNFDVKPLLSEDQLEGGQPASVIVASEPVTLDKDSWLKISSGQAVLIDNYDPGSKKLSAEIRFMALARASCAVHPGKPKQAIMFQNDLFAVIDASKPPREVASIVEEKRSITNVLDARNHDLPKLSAGVDAVLPNPVDKRKMHFFGGDKYMYVDIDPSKSPLSITAVERTPSKIVASDIIEVFECFGRRGYENFRNISACLPVPESKNTAWFFSGSGSEYLLVSWTQDSDGNITSSKAQGFGKQVSDLPFFQNVGFSTVNMTLPHWEDKYKAWFFCGDSVALLELSTNGNFEETKIVGKAEFVSKHWPGIFYQKPSFDPVPSFNEIQEDQKDDKSEEEKRAKRKKIRDAELGLDDVTPSPPQHRDEERERLEDLQRGKVRIACQVFPWNQGQVYVYRGDRYMILSHSNRTVAQNWSPITKSEFRFFGPRFYDLWNSGLDAVFPMPLREGEDAHFFCGDKYASAMVVDNKLSRGPVSLVNTWECLKTAGFGKIDAALEVPNSQNEVWFFSGRKYIRASWKGAGKSIQSSILEGPLRIDEQWQALKDAKFSRVDMILPASERGQVLIFSGKQYALVSTNGSAVKSELKSNPKAVSGDWNPEFASCFEV